MTDAVHKYPQAVPTVEKVDGAPQPIRDFILIRMVTRASTSEGGIEMPGADQYALPYGHVFACGPDCTDTAKASLPTKCVIVPPHAGSMIELKSADNGTWRFVREMDLVGWFSEG